MKKRPLRRKSLEKARVFIRAASGEENFLGNKADVQVTPRLKPSTLIKSGSPETTLSRSEVCEEKA